MPARILVIEDDQSIADLIEAVLSDEGHEILLHPTMSLPTLADVARIDPSLIILDHFFSGHHADSDGLRWLEELKGRQETAATGVIVCSAAVDQLATAAEYLQTHAVAVVHKPFMLEVLLERVGRALDAREGRASSL